MFTIEALVDAMTLEAVGANQFRAGTVKVGHVLFGGQLLGQSIVAARAGNEGKAVKTLHTVFARSGSTEAPVEIEVDPVHSGRALASATVTISQGERVCTR